MDYTATPFQNTIVIDALVSIHYFEYAHDFSFSGESHDFWEFLFVDKGEIEVDAGEKTVLLNKGDIIFHQPMEFHRLRATGANSPDLVVSAFVCRSEAMRFFENRILKLDSTGRDLLLSLIHI